MAGRTCVNLPLAVWLPVVSRRISSGRIFCRCANRCLVDNVVAVHGQMFCLVFFLCKHANFKAPTQANLTKTFFRRNHSLRNCNPVQVLFLVGDQFSSRTHLQASARVHLPTRKGETKTDQRSPHLSSRGQWMRPGPRDIPSLSPSCPNAPNHHTFRDNLNAL